MVSMARHKSVMLPPMAYYMANNPVFCSIYPEVTKMMIEQAKKFPPKNCQECFFFKWVFGGEKRPICGGSCAANREIEFDKFDYGIIPEGCPITDQTRKDGEDGKDWH